MGLSIFLQRKKAKRKKGKIVIVEEKESMPLIFTWMKLGTRSGYDYLPAPPAPRFLFARNSLYELATPKY